jgi:hypothetical protein
MSNQVSVKINDIVLGSRLQFPIADARGTLLLAAGMEFTGEYRQRLLDRGIEQVLMDETDAANVTREEKAPKEPASLHKPRLSADDRLSRMSIRNTGEALVKSLHLLGTTPYNSTWVAEGRRLHDLGAATIESMMNSAHSGATLDGRRATQIIDAYIKFLSADLDAALAIMRTTQTDASLPRHSMSAAIVAMAIGIELGLDTENVRIVGIWAWHAYPRQF